MATYYWVGGSGTWNTTTATNWSLSSGGSGGAGVPTMMDDVIFNSSSNSVLYTVTISTGATCRDWTVAGPLAGNVTLTPPTSGTIYVFGSVTFAASGITWTNNSTTLNFAATTTGKTVTFGTAVGSSSNFTFDGVGGGWTLGAALSATAGNLTVNAGSFNSGNFNISIFTLSSSNSNVRSITLGTSTLSVGGATTISFATSTNLTLSAASSTINLSSSSAIFAGGGLSFGTVTFPANWASSITGANTFANLTITAATTSGSTGGTLAANQTVTGTFTASGTSATQRCKLSSGTAGTQYTITAATVSLSDVDFLDIVGAGVAAPFTGTRLGNLGNNSGITFATKTVYWSLVAGGNWNATAWATSSGGTPAVANFPLAQDTATIDTTGLTASNTITLNVVSYALPNINVTRTTAWTLACGIVPPAFYGNVTLNTNTTTSGTGAWNFISRSTQTLTSNGVTIVPPITAGGNGIPGTLTLGDALTNTGSALTVYNLNVNGFSASCVLFSAGGAVSISTTTAGSTITVTGSGASAAAIASSTSITGNLTISLTSASAKTFALNSNSGGVVTINQGGSGALTITGGPYIYGLTNTVQPATVSITSGTTLTVQNFALTGTAGNLITVNAVTAGTAASISRPSTGISSVQYCAFQDITSTNANLFARNSTNTSGNTGITFLTVAATTFYWVPAAGVASGTWDATTTTNWATSSGGAAGAGVPTIDDNVVFDANSNVTTGAFTVTVGTNAWCKDLTISGLDGAMTFAGTGTLGISGSATIPTTNVTRTFTGPLNFVALTTGKTVSIAPTMASSTTFDGVGGGWTLSSAINASTSTLTVANGTFSTSASNFSITIFQLVSIGTATRSISLNASTITLGNINLNATGLTWNAGTSSIVNNQSGNVTFNGAGQTFYDYSATGAFYSLPITGANTFHNLSFPAWVQNGKQVSFDSNITVTGTLTCPVSGTIVGGYRNFLASATIGTPITITAAAVSLTDVDFRDIVGAGAASWSGTRLGDCGGNSGITFPAAKTVYMVGTTQTTFQAALFSTTSGGSTSTANFPLPQDTAIINNNSISSGQTLTLFAAQYGNLDFSGLTNTITLSTNSVNGTIGFYGNFTGSSSITSGATAYGINFQNRTAKTFTSAGITFNCPFAINTVAASSLQLLDNVTTTAATTLTQGTLDLNNKTLTALTWSSSNSNTRSILFGTGKISVNGTGASLFAMSTATNFSYTGTSTVEINNATATASTVNMSSATESQALNFNIISGSYALTLTNAKNVNFTGFTGSLVNSTRTIYGNLTLVSGMSVTAGTSITTFGATSGTQQITSATQTLDFPVTINGIGGTVQLVDALTVGATRAVLLTNGTFDANGQNVSIGTFASTAQGPRTIAFGSGTWSVSGATFNVSNSSGMTVTGSGILSMTSASAKAFTGGYVNGKWPTLRQGGAGALTVTANAGGVYFANMTNNTQPATVTYTVSLQYIYDAFSLAGTSGNLITINSSTSGTKALLNLVSGRVASSNYLSIQDSYAEPTTTTWYAGANSTNVSGNVGWIFTAAPSLGNTSSFFLVMG